MPLAHKDTRLTRDNHEELARGYADEAIKMLQQAVAKGFKDANYLKNETPFTPLRSRKDFQKLVTEVEAKSKP